MQLENESEEEKVETPEGDTNEGETQDGADSQEDPNPSPDNEEFKFEDDGAGPVDDQTPKGTDPDSKPTDSDSADLDDDNKKVIKSVAKEAISEEMAPLLAEREKVRVEKEWSKMVADYPELKSYEAKILRFANHDKYKGKPITQSVLDVAGVDVFVKIGAKRSKQADSEANRTKNTGGVSPRPTDSTPGKIPSFVGMSPAQIKEWTNKAKSGRLE